MNNTHTIALGDNRELLDRVKPGSIHLIFTSPPYYNARPEYSEFETYGEYLDYMRLIIRKCHTVLAEGRFFVINVSPVLVPREKRSKSSTRLAIPFDFHHIFTHEGYEFIDDIIWQKPAGAATRRGGFSQHRQPLQYKPMQTTEYLLVYRKKTERLIDWNIRQYPDEIREASKVRGAYEVTNVWNIPPDSAADHPAIFPRKLADRVVSYYSFVGDIVLDPFAGIGTTGIAAARLKRGFYLIEQQAAYIEGMKRRILSVLGKEAGEVETINTAAIDTSAILF